MNDDLTWRICEHVEANRLHPDGRHMLANNISPERAARILETR